MNSGRVLFFGYGEVGYRALELLLQRGVTPVAVYTHEDDPDENQWFRSVAALAERNGIPVRTPSSLRGPERLAEIEALAPDLILSFYYRRLIPEPVLALARLGALNMHGSLLPRYRGRAPVNWAVLHGETETGATLHHMVSEADAGDVVDQQAVPIAPDETAGEVALKVADAAVVVLARQLDALLEGTAPRTPQDHARATVFGGRRPEDGRIEWKQPARNVVNLVRAVTRPFPGAFSDGPRGRLMVWRARTAEAPEAAAPGTVIAERPLTIACGQGAVALLEWGWNDPEMNGAPPPRGASVVGEESLP